MIRSAPFQRRYTEAGAPPGAFVRHAGAVAPRMQTILYNADHLEESQPASLGDIPDPSDEQVLWIDVCGLANHDLIDAIGARFGLHRLVLADIVSISNRTNEIMRVLTVLATIFIPLTFLAGVYGMNFDLESSANMPELSWRDGYVFFWLLCGVVAGGLLFGFRRMGWLGGKTSSDRASKESQS